MLLCEVCGLCGWDVAGDSPVSLHALLLTVSFRRAEGGSSCKGPLKEVTWDVDVSPLALL